MKMGDRRLKKLDRIGVNVQNKPRLTAEPVNRSERRALERFARRHADEINNAIMTAEQAEDISRRST